jgi:hypothetical protein
MRGYHNEFSTRVEYVGFPDTVPHDPNKPHMREVRRVEFVVKAGLIQVIVHQKNTPSPEYRASQD